MAPPQPSHLALHHAPHPVPSAPYETARGLPGYPGETSPQAERTHVDPDVEARARAMNRASQLLTTEAYVPADSSMRPGPNAQRFERDGAPTFGAAMRARVRFAGAEVPAWSLVAPVVVLAALGSALGASAVSSSPRRSAPALTAAESIAAGAPSATSSTAAKAPDAPAAPARAGAEEKPQPRPLDVSELPPTAELPSDLETNPGKYASAELIGFADARSKNQVEAARALERTLDRDPGAIKEQKILSDVRRLASNPETSRVVLGAIAKLPGPIAADLLYELWTGTVEKNETTELARALLYSRDVRPRASGALAVALDLREAEACDQAKSVVVRAAADGDRRALHPLIRMQRKYGCGTNKRQDCFPCLRKGEELENAIKAVKERREPRTFKTR